MNGVAYVKTYALPTFSSRAGTIRGLTVLCGAFLVVFAATMLTYAAIGAATALAAALLLFTPIGRRNTLLYRVVAGLPLYGPLIAMAVITLSVSEMLLFAAGGIAIAFWALVFLRDGSVEVTVRSLTIRRPFVHRSISLDEVAGVQRYHFLFAAPLRFLGGSDFTAAVRVRPWAHRNASLIYLNLAPAEIDDFLQELAGLLEPEPEDTPIAQIA